MALSDNIFLPGNQCEICGAELSDEIIIQEFADGSIARLCAECAAGAALQAEGGDFRFPDPDPASAGAGEVDAIDVSPDSPASADLPGARVPRARTPQPAAIDADALEKTRELLTPVVDLITLQSEMQGALQRLAASLQTFASGVISENLDKTATVESRLESLERELELTRARLRETEALLAAGSSGASAGSTAPPARAAQSAPSGPTALPGPAPAAASSPWDFDTTAESSLETTPSDGATQPYSLGDLESTLPPVAQPAASPPVAPPDGPATAEHHSRPTFSLAEVQVAQKYFNDSQFTNRVREVRKSLGKPKANLSKLIGAEPRAVVTVAWDIIWYQYLVDLRRDIPTDQRVTLHREGMDLAELTAVFREKNASLDDEGRLDASELEVKLLSDPSTLITEMTVEEEQALEDATEEIWDQKTAPEFKWDD